MCSAMRKDLILQGFEDCKKTVHLLKESVKKFKPYDTGKIYSPDELEYLEDGKIRISHKLSSTVGEAIAGANYNGRAFSDQ